MGQFIFNPTRTHLTTYGLSESGSVQLTFEKIEFFSIQPDSNSWWARY